MVAFSVAQNSAIVAILGFIPRTKAIATNVQGISNNTYNVIAEITSYIQTKYR